MVKYNYDYRKLRGRIREKIGTERDLAKEIGRSNTFLTAVFNGKSYFTPNDITNICKVLDITETEISLYFFAV